MALVISSAGIAQAGNKDGVSRERKWDKMTEKLDADGDGQLSLSEFTSKSKKKMKNTADVNSVINHSIVHFSFKKM